MKPIAALGRLLLAIAISVVLLLGVSNVITQPVASVLDGYSAEFTDVSGLHAGADVRVRGVQAGKVQSLQLQRRSEQSIAEVAFTLDSRYRINSDTRLAVKYQALTGLRYLEVVDPSESSQVSATLRHIPISMTEPSFDITKLFNGLQPVLATLSPDDLNQFTENVDNFFQGDGNGLGEILQSIHTLTQFLANRQQVVATILENLKEISDTMSGHAKDFIKIIDGINKPINAALDVLDEFRKSHVYGPEFTAAVVRVLNGAGLKPGIDVDLALDKALTNVDNFMDAIKLVPAIWDNIPAPTQAGQPLKCSLGRAELPLPVDVLLNGQRVTLCKQ